MRSTGSATVSSISRVAAIGRDQRPAQHPQIGVADGDDLAAIGAGDDAARRAVVEISVVVVEPGWRSSATSSLMICWLPSARVTTTRSGVLSRT